MADSRSSTVQDQARTQTTPQRRHQQDITPRRQAATGLQRYSSDPFASPSQLFRRLSDEMDRVFDRAFGGGLSRAGGSGFADFSTPVASAMWAPRIEAFQKGDEFIVRAELPGLAKDDVRVNLTDDAIVIEGERRDESEEKRDGFYHTERSYGSFYRAIPLPEGAIGDKAEASFKDGVLEVKLHAPPHEVTRGRRIDIK